MATNFVKKTLDPIRKAAIKEDYISKLEQALDAERDELSESFIRVAQSFVQGLRFHAEQDRNLNPAEAWVLDALANNQAVDFWHAVFDRLETQAPNQEALWAFARNHDYNAITITPKDMGEAAISIPAAARKLRDATVAYASWRLARQMVKSGGLRGHTQTLADKINNLKSKTCSLAFLHELNHRNTTHKFLTLPLSIEPGEQAPRIAPTENMSLFMLSSSLHRCWANHDPKAKAWRSVTEKFNQCVFRESTALLETFFQNKTVSLLFKDTQRRIQGPVDFLNSPQSAAPEFPMLVKDGVTTPLIAWVDALDHFSASVATDTEKTLTLLDKLSDVSS